jgi:predicted P-loop ATPase
MSRKPTKMALAKELISAMYEFRYNVIKGLPEYIELKQPTDFIPVDDYRVNTIKGELDENGLEVSSALIREIIISNYSEPINPVQNYIQNLPTTNGHHHLDALITTVTVTPDQQNEFKNLFTKWMVALIANAMDDNYCRNHTCLVLCGAQGTFKTSFLELLVPAELKQYLYTGRIDPENKDTLSIISENLLVNIDDQLREINKKDENQIKNLITINKVKYRRSYGHFVKEYPKMASFCASINGNEFLADVTGSRRFLPFQIEKIDIQAATSVNMAQVYAECRQLWQSGFQYWFTHDEVARLNERNSQFEIISSEVELIHEYFDIPQHPDTHKEDANIFLTASAVKALLEKETGQKLSLKKIGEALKKMGAIKWQRRNTANGKPNWVYSLKRLSSEEVYDRRQPTAQERPPLPDKENLPRLPFAH